MSMKLNIASLLACCLLAVSVGAPVHAADWDADETLTEEDRKNLRRLENLPTIPEPKLGELNAVQKQVLERVNARWKAMLAFDLEAVYAFATPSYRATYDQRHLNSQYALQVQRTKAEPVSIVIEGEKQDIARVKTKLNFRTNLPGIGQPYIGTSWVDETWSLVDGQWWFVEPK